MRRSPHELQRGGPGLYFRELRDECKFVFLQCTSCSAEKKDPDDLIYAMATIVIFLGKVLSVVGLILVGNVDDLRPSTCAFAAFGFVAFQTLIVAVESPFERAQVALFQDESQ